jgi:glycosyltransferase involved in cell wall biosynthesis
MKFKSLKVVMVVWKYFPVFEGGAERQCRKLVTELSARGVDCTVLTARVERRLSVEEVIPGGGRVVRIGSLSFVESFFRYYFRYCRKFFFKNGTDKQNDFLEFWCLLPFVWIARFSFLVKLKRYLRQNHSDIDVLHVHEAHWIAGAVAWANNGLNIPIVCKEADFPVSQGISYDTPMRGALTQCRRHVNFIAMTKEIFDGLVANGIKKDQIFCIPNGVVVPNAVAQFDLSQDVVYIGNLTQGTRRKAFDILFEAWVKVVQINNSARLIVLGAGDPSGWKEYLEKNKCLHTVKFKGAVPDVSLYLKNARAFVLPSRVEGLSNALLEAMSWGVPVVISDISAHRSVIQHEENGLVVPVDNSELLAQAVLKLLGDEILCRKLSRNALETIQEKYSMTVVSASLIKLYSALVSQNESKEI